MFFGAARTQRTEAAVVVWTRRQLALRIDVEVQALVAVTAEAVPQKEVALGHFSQVELVKELAGLALLAQAPKPMLADQRVERMPAAAAAILLGGVGDMAFRAAGAEGAVAIGICSTYRAIGG